MDPRADDVAGRWINFGLLLLIAVNVTASILATDAEILAMAPRFFYWFERFSIAVFTTEYILRLWSCSVDPRFAGAFGHLRYTATPMAVIDLASIAPFYVVLMFPGTIDLRFLRVLRLLRLFRLIRIRRVADSLTLVLRVIQSKRAELGITLAVVVTAVLLAAGAIYVAERNHVDTQFTSIPRAMWWSIVTITTIGYGDMVPMTSVGKVIGGVVGFVGICAIALPVGILSSGFIEELNRRQSTESTESTDEPRRCTHCHAVIDRR
jgi:voltage-gated potassium channel